MYRVYHAVVFDLMVGGKPKLLTKKFPNITSAQREVSSLIEKAIKRNGAEGMVESQHLRRNKVDEYTICPTGTNIPMEVWLITDKPLKWTFAL